MLVETRHENTPQWVHEAAPEGATVVLSQVTLCRNLADFPFTQRCTEDEKQAIETRILNALDSLNLLASGRYYNMRELDSRAARLLAERRLISQDMLGVRGPRGVYVADDQSLSISINGAEHLAVRGIAAGQQLQELWNRLNLIDDTLNGALDFAFDERLGYLTSTLGLVGTGLKVGLLLHLPTLVYTNRITEQLSGTEQQRLLLQGVRAGCDVRLPRTRPDGEPEQAVLSEALFTDMNGALPAALNETVGDLFLLVNQSTLGHSEEEIVFQIRHRASEILAGEGAAREGLLAENLGTLEDRVGRAQGVASGARLLGFPEGLDLLSSLRLGVAAGLAQGVDLPQINELLLASQSAHLEASCGHECDALQLSAERAGLFRNRLVPATRKLSPSS